MTVTQAYLRFIDSIVCEHQNVNVIDGCLSARTVTSICGHRCRLHITQQFSHFMTRLVHSILCFCQLLQAEMFLSIDLYTHTLARTYQKHTHTCTHTYTHTYTHTRAHVHTHTHARTHTLTCTCTHTHTHTHTCLSTYIR